MKITLDAGHGNNTPGKRTPDDSMREFHFNNAVANYARELLLKYENVIVDFAHDPSGKVDIALIARTNTANSKKSDVYVSIHANAYGSNWNDANGIEAFVHTTASAVSKNLATLIQSKLIKATSLKNRGVKSADFHVLRETNMPAVLVECGFMTNRDEAALLMSDDYRRLCAKAIAEALAEFYNLKLKKEEDKLYKPNSKALEYSTEHTLRTLIKEGVISDSWLKKLQNGTLTESEATGLLFVAMERKFLK